MVKLKVEKKKSRYKAAVAAVIAIILIVIAVVLFCSTRKDEGIVCYINDEPVYEQEVVIAADQAELAAEQDFAELTGQEMGNVDFSVEVDGKTGYEYLAEAVKEELVRMKIIQIDAKEHGLCDAITYPEIEKEREEENRQRAETKSEDGVVYGITSFDEEEYYRYFIDNLDIQNKRYLSQTGEITATDEEAEAEYEKDPSAFDNQEYESVSMFVKNAVITRKYEEYMDKLESSAMIENEENIAVFLEKIKS